MKVIGKPGSWRKLEIPLYLEPVSAGFPSPAQDYVERKLDLNELCIIHPAATYFTRVEGDSMIEAGIYPGDVLVVDRSLDANHEDIVVACLFGEFTVKQLERYPEVRLIPRNRAYKPISVGENELDIFGVVVSIIRNLRR